MAEKKRPRGQPRKPPENVKSWQLKVRVTEHARAEMDAAAEREGISLSKWVRQVLQAAAKDLKTD
jgi:predicted HicB family RNase H-like nuclease